MGLSRDSVGLNALDTTFVTKKAHADDKVVALAGNPNVGKSTVFNELTGLRQHTGNWPGKTVAIAQGYYTYKQKGYVIVDLPGCYSLMARSAEEEAARDFICFGNADAVIVVCDATCLERSLNLVLQTLEITQNVVVCVNLMDEAKKKGIAINLPALAEKLGVPVVGTSARSGRGLDELLDSVRVTGGNTPEHNSGHIAECRSENVAERALRVRYPDSIEQALSALEPSVQSLSSGILAGKSIYIDSRWLALMLLQQDLHEFESCEYEKQKLGLMNLINTYYNESITDKPIASEAITCGLNPHEPIIEPERANLMLTCQNAQESLSRQGIGIRQIKDEIVCSIVHAAEALCRDILVYDDVRAQGINPPHFDSTVDKLLTGKWTAFPLMILALMGVFWLTITGSNYPSQVMSGFLFWVEDQLVISLQGLGVPPFLYEMLVLGVYRVLAWVVSVMLPPMAIFFPLFTLLEDVGFLPRIAFNLDKWFKKCSACGKQALTMCMGPCRMRNQIYM